MPFARPLAAFAAGAMVCAAWPQAWLAYWPALLILVLVSCLFISRLRPWLPVLLAAVLGALLFGSAVDRAQAKMLSAGCDGHVINLEFEIVGLPQHQINRGQPQWKLLAKPLNNPLSDCFKDTKALISLSFWAPRYGKTVPLLFNGGDQISAQVKLRRPHSSLNPGGFDYVAWLWRQDIYATGYIKSISNHLPGVPSNRSVIKQKIDSALRGHGAHPLLLALLIGDRSSISHELWQQARETGVAHLLAISGLHLGLLVAAIFFLSSAFAGCLPRQRGWPSSVLLAPAVLAAVAYASLAGWPLSAQRALLMIVVAWLAFALNWRMPRFLAWSAALVLVLLWQPLAVLDGGFYLSFIAVAILLWAASARAPRHWHAKLAMAFKLQLALLVGLLPLQWWFFGGFSLISLPVNLLVVPLFALLLMPALLCLGLMLLLGIPGAELLLVWMADLLGVLLEWLAQLHQLSQGSFLGWQIVGRPTAGQMSLLVAAVLMLFMPRALGLRGLGLIVLLLGISVTPLSQYWGGGSLAHQGAFRITSFDAGQGTALLVETQKHRLIYDTGAKWGSGKSAMRSMILPSLATLGIRELDKIVISHDDNDHAGGLEHLLLEYPATVVSGTDPTPCHQGQQWLWDGVEFTVLSPAGGLNNSNNQSCVIRISSRYGSALLTGDISQTVERRLVASHTIDVDWLLVPHHGSKSSSHLSFINAVSADTAVITSGHNNRYGLPAADVLAKYQQQRPRLRLFNTADDGAVSSTFGPECRPCNQTERQNRRWWQR